MAQGFSPAFAIDALKSLPPSQPIAPMPSGPPHVEALKQEVAADVASMRAMTQQMVDHVFSYGSNS